MKCFKNVTSCATNILYPSTLQGIKITHSRVKIFARPVTTLFQCVARGGAAPLWKQSGGKRRRAFGSIVHLRHLACLESEEEKERYDGGRGEVAS